jgi:hypothetical protein
VVHDSHGINFSIGGAPSTQIESTGSAAFETLVEIDTVRCLTATPRTKGISKVLIHVNTHQPRELSYLFEVQSPTQPRQRPHPLDPSSHSHLSTILCCSLIHTRRFVYSTLPNWVHRAPKLLVALVRIPLVLFRALLLVSHLAAAGIRSSADLIRIHPSSTSALLDSPQSAAIV